MRIHRTVLLIPLLFAAPAARPADAPAPAPGLSVRDGRFVRDGRPYRGVGANYFDLFLRVLHSPTNTTSLEGLDRLAKAGIPFVRFGGAFSEQDWRVYLDRPGDYFACMDKVFRAAEKAGIGLIPSLFWSRNLPEALGEPRDQWGNPSGRTHDLMRRYVADFAARYKDSPALWAWEFGNEPNLSVDLPNAKQFRPPGGTERDDLKSAHLVVMLSEFAKEVRRHDPHRALLSGNSHPRSCAWHNTHEGSWTSDSPEQSREVLLRDNPAPFDTIGIHFYGDAPVQKAVAAWATDDPDYLRWACGLAREAGRPLFIGEFGLASKDDPARVRAVFGQLLADMDRAGVDLAAFWVYDLRDQKAWNVTFDNDRAWMISAAAEASRQWTAAAAAAAPRAP